ncbi:mitogen-activated protein kinase kinase kinase 2-like [Oculina patagonica]
MSDDLNLCQGHEFRAPLGRDCGTKYHNSLPFREWLQGRLLGAGAYGKVYECFPVSHSLDFKKRLAVKIVKIEPQYTEMSKGHKAIRNEIEILMNLRHERIVSFYGSEERDDHLHLFMDFMAGGSLADHIKTHTALFEGESKKYTKQILEGVSYLHAENIIHRDIKGANVLLDRVGNVKLGDFGLSKIIQKIGSKTDLISHCGTPHWMAPEIIQGKGYGRKADIWSVGCTVVEMLTGRPPLGHLEPVAAIFRIGLKPTVFTLPEGVSEDAKEFIEAALTWKPDERPWSDELLSYAFVQYRTEFNHGCYGAGYP